MINQLSIRIRIHGESPFLASPEITTALPFFLLGSQRGIHQGLSIDLYIHEIFSSFVSLLILNMYIQFILLFFFLNVNLYPLFCRLLCYNVEYISLYLKGENDHID